MTLAEREYWTPAEAAQVVGRNRSYWIKAFDSGRIVGYRTESGHRQLLAASVREFLEAQHNTAPAKPLTVSETLSQFRLKWRAHYSGGR